MKIAFLHEDIRNLFAASYLKEKWEAGEDFKEYFKKEVWHDFLIFMSSILECSDELISNLSESDPFLAAQCLASATRINEGIEEAVIKGLSKALRNKNEEVRSNAASALGKIKVINYSLGRWVKIKWAKLQGKNKDKI